MPPFFPEPVYQHIKGLDDYILIAVSAIQSTVPRPKPAANAYTIFYSEQYPEFKKQCILIALSIRIDDDHVSP